MPPTDQDARIRLGQQLVGRRAQISARYKNRRTFAAETGLNWRLLYDVEQAKRDNFRLETLRAFETAYRLTPGSLDRFDGELEPLPADVPRIAAVPDPPLPGAELGALNSIAALIASATPAELEKLDALLGATVQDNEVLRLLHAYPDPKGPVGKRLDLKMRLTMMRQYLAADPRGVLDDEDRQRGTGA